MSEFANFVEYCVEKKSEGSYRQKRVWLRILSVLAGLAIIPVVTYSVAGKFFIAFVPVWMGLVGILYWFLSRFVSLEYEYRILQGEFQMDVIYGQRQRKRIADIRIHDMKEIAPFTEEARAKINACAKVYNCAISVAHPTTDLYYCIYEDAAHNTCAMYFEATLKTLDIMKFYNSRNIIMKKDLRH